MPATSSLLRQVLEEGFLRAGLKTPLPIVESSNPITNLQLVSSGIGLGVIPKQTLQAAEGQGLIAPVPVSPALSPIPVAMVTRTNQQNHRTGLLREILLG